MFNYNKIFYPFRGDGATLENTISWLKKTTKADDRIIDQAIAVTMNMVAAGETFPLPCPCGCGGTNIHTSINHYMLSEVLKIEKQTLEAVTKVIEENQKKLTEKQLKQLSDFDKEYGKLINGTFWENFTDLSLSPVWCFFKKQNYKNNKTKKKLDRLRKYRER